MVSANRQIQATDFAFDAARVDNWRDSQVTHLKFKVSGVQQGLSTAHVKLSGYCAADPDTPTIGDDGMVDIPVTVYSSSPSCSVTGLRLTDNAGNTSLYGTDFGAPDLGLTVSRNSRTPSRRWPTRPSCTGP